MKKKTIKKIKMYLQLLKLLLKILCGAIAMYLFIIIIFTIF